MLRVYHGSDKIIERPLFDYGKVNNDYGKGFYTTPNIELASEWACRKNNDGFVNIYDLDDKNLKTLELNEKKYDILNWLAILVQNRKFNLDTELLSETTKYLIKNYNINYKNYDAIIGYRADDSYFTFATDFLQNLIPLSILEKAFALGELGTQIAIISAKAFKQIKFVEAKKIFADKYFRLYIDRDLNARETYRDMRANLRITKDEIFMSDILREKS